MNFERTKLVLRSKHFRHVRRIVVAIVGGVVLVVGILLVFVPGPALVVIPMGLGILALEFVWARRSGAVFVGWVRGLSLAKNRFRLVSWLRAIPHRHYLAALGVLFTVYWIALGIAPHNRGAWALENLPVVSAVVGVALFHKWLLLSRVSYTLIFLFLCLHGIGAHYTYERVPYDGLFEQILGRSLNDFLGWERNNYDRLVHFLYGLFLAYPIREVFLRVANVRGFWGYFLPLDLTMSTSMLYELLEWSTAVVFGGGAAAYLGVQGDEWDAHKDMALASLGALLAMTVTALINRSFQRDFAREWNHSLRVKNTRPLGEDEAARMLAK